MLQNVTLPVGSPSSSAEHVKAFSSKKKKKKRNQANSGKFAVKNMKNQVLTSVLSFKTKNRGFSLSFKKKPKRQQVRFTKKRKLSEKKAKLEQKSRSFNPKKTLKPHLKPNKLKFTTDFTREKKGLKHWKTSHQTSSSSSSNAPRSFAGSHQSSNSPCVWSVARNTLPSIEELPNSNAGISKKTLQPLVLRPLRRLPNPASSEGAQSGIRSSEGASSKKRRRFKKKRKESSN